MSGEHKIADKRELFLKIINETEINWKHAAYLLQNIISCWRETGDSKGILEYDRFDKEETEELIRILSEGINLYNVLSRYKVPEDKSLAVIAPHQFSRLDKKILPDEHDTIEVFTDEEHSLPEFKIFNSATEIVEAVIKNTDDPKDVAVVMGKKSQYRHLIESAFRTSNIPYMVSTDFKESDDLRSYLKLLRYGLFGRGLIQRDVKPLLHHFDIPTAIEQDEYYIHSIDDLADFRKLLNSIPKLSFKEIVEDFERISGREQPDLKEHLEYLDLTDEQITKENLNSLEYYIESFDITVDDAKRGVLIASPKSSAFIDRSMIFYLGMDTSWTSDTPTNPWTKKR